MVCFKKILVPVDFSHNCKASIKYSLELAEQFQSTITLLHVISNNDIEAIEKASQLLVDNTAEELVEERKKFEKNELLEFFPPEQAKGIDVKYSVASGRPFHEIIYRAEKDKTDLIVICTHGKSNLPYVLFGSVAERVIRKSPCPVLVIQAKHSLENTPCKV